MTLTDATWTLYDALGRSVGHCRARNHAEAVFLLHLSDERAASGWSVSEDAATATAPAPATATATAPAGFKHDFIHVCPSN